MNIAMNFAERLKELRAEKNLSMRALAEKIQVSDAAICKWENGENEPKATYIKRLCAFFEVSADYFFEKGEISISTPIENDLKDFYKAQQELNQIFQSLSQDNRAHILEFARYIADRSGLNILNTTKGVKKYKGRIPKFKE